ncbi:Sulfurtransferase [bioreactor metagenome]|uniref:Sulfurtransferase n=1 Tax=bioreactor metagenome TaxID=1076179 RepID=A0A645GUG5_9ZZZZ
MIAHIRPAQLAEWFASAPEGARPLVLDVREVWEVQTAHLAPAEFDIAAIPMGEITSRLAELDPARPVACLCHHGMRSLRVAGYLAQQGFDNVANITGGIDAWSEEVDPAVPRY